MYNNTDHKLQEPSHHSPLAQDKQKVGDVYAKYEQYISGIDIEYVSAKE